MKSLVVVINCLLFAVTVTIGNAQAKPVNLNSSGVTELEQSGGLLDRYFGLDNLLLLDSDEPPLWTAESVSAFSLIRWPGFIRDFGILDADGIFAPILDRHSDYQSGPVDLGHLHAPFGFGLFSNPIPASSALVPGDTYAQTTMRVWQVLGGEHGGSYLFTWEDVVGGGPRNHHDLVIVVNGIQMAGPDLHPVPVPAALWLLGSGLLALFGLLRRRA